MSREIKFRAWNKENKRWLDEVAVFNDGSWCGDIIQPNHTRVSGYSEPDCVLMQYTGLKDCKGQEIYEGDVLKQRRRSWTGKGEVVFDSGCYWFHRRLGSGQEELYIAIGNEEVEVIGNLWENPKLLEAKQ